MEMVVAARARLAHPVVLWSCSVHAYLNTTHSMCSLEVTNCLNRCTKELDELFMDASGVARTDDDEHVLVADVRGW